MCVSTVSYEFCFNGSTIGPICPSRGLRQGDPLSPYLFLLCVEGLSSDLSKAAADGTIHGSTISPTAPSITHLLFADDSFLFFRADQMETQAVKQLLIHYEELSGQSVNFNKSGIHFSSNVRRQKRDELSAILGVTKSLQNSNYLGLPSLVGRSKKKVFGFVKDKVCKRVQGWQAKPISRAGKAVLVRNVAQSIPTYCMTCFLLPKTLCQEIEQVMNNFWWKSGSDQGKGINWLSWGSMSMSKHRGGLGFRSLHGFNLALIGKHCWNFLKNPQSLVARVFKARYFPSCNFLQAKMQKGSSYIWSGIIAAKNTLFPGYRWVLGDGRNINAVRDPWLKHKEGFCVSQNEDYGVNFVSVAEFIDPLANDWNVTKVQSFFSEADAELILATRVPYGNCSDRLAWTRTSNGHYSVKTGYQLWYDQNVKNDTVKRSSGWGKIWRIDLPHKVKIFLWRFCRNNLPVRKRLSSKGVSYPITCPMCNADIEHKLHLFFDCHFAVSCWDYIGFRYDMSRVEFAPDWLLDKLHNAPFTEVAAIVRVLWGVWFFRNKRVWEGKNVTASFAMDWSSKFISDWRSAKASRLMLTAVGVKHYSSVVHKWRPPERGMLKLNVDAAYKVGLDSFSIGLVLRDHLGSFVAGKVLCFKIVSSVLEAETMAVHEGLKWLCSMPHQLVEVESDALLVVQAIKCDQNNLLEVGFILDACREMLKYNPGLSLSFAKRQANNAAHLMAKVPCLLNCQSYFTSPPSVLLETLCFDAKFE